MSNTTVHIIVLKTPIQVQKRFCIAIPQNTKNYIGY